MRRGWMEAKGGQMKKPVAYSGATCTCTDCGRVLWVEDGPTCPECKALREVAKDGKQPQRDEQPKPVKAPKARGGCCG